MLQTVMVVVDIFFYSSTIIQVVGGGNHRIAKLKFTVNKYANTPFHPITCHVMYLCSNVFIDKQHEIRGGC